MTITEKVIMKLQVDLQEQAEKDGQGLMRKQHSCSLI